METSPDLDPTIHLAADKDTDKDTRTASDQSTAQERKTVLEPTNDPTEVGPFQILSKLGEGGMGSVFLALQTHPVKRKVALKIMRSTRLDEEGKIRFEAERQAMARFQHPNVAQIFEAGSTEEGYPYFAMELANGETITKYCDAGRLSIQQRLDLFRDICAGVQHAHQKGIIHRDLKPSNIVVTEIEGRPIPKIIDFGIAKTIDEPLGDSALVTGDRLIGTPAYLSPEAVAVGEHGADIDTRSDVYSLGILLYELLVGHRPFDDKGANMFQVLQRVAAAEPTEPSKKWSQLDVDTRSAIAAQRRLEPMALRGSLRGDLDWIVLKAIAKDRQNRYGSAAELAADVRRHQRHEPVEASPPSTLYRMQKFVRRRVGTVVAVLMVILTLIGGVVARTFEAQRANREAAAAVAAREQAEEALRKEVAARAEAKQVTEFLADLFKVSDPSEAMGNTVTARELLDSGAQRIRDGLAAQPLARARFMQVIGDVYRKLGLYEDAQTLIEEALELYRKHLPTENLELTNSLNGLANLHAELGRFKESEPLFEQVLAIRERLVAPNAPEIGVALSNLANTYSTLHKFDQAEALYLRAVAIAEGYNAEDAEKDWGDLFVALNNLADLYSSQERYDEANPLYQRFMEHVRSTSGDSHPYFAFSLENLAYVRDKLGDGADAEKLYLQALEILEKVYGPDHPEVAYCLSYLARLYSDLKRYAEAAPLFRRALAIQEAALPEDHPERKATAEAFHKLRQLSGS